MEAFMAFISSFASYLLLMVVMLAIIGVAIIVGVALRKRKDAGAAQGEASPAQAAASPVHTAAEVSQ